VTRRRSFLALVALLGVGGQHPPPRASGSASDDASSLPIHLADTGLFAPGSIEVIASGVRPFVPQYPLWSDGAAKRRWFFIPEGASIDASNPRRWGLPRGSRLWNELSIGGRRGETRMLWKY
jgi:hypothetical protein